MFLAFMALQWRDHLMNIKCKANESKELACKAIIESHMYGRIHFLA